MPYSQKALKQLASYHWILLLAPSLFWAWQTWPFINQTGFEQNDIVRHTHFIDLILNSWRNHSIGLEAWTNHCCFGAPAFRTYQNMGHFISAAAARVFGLTGFETVHLISFMVIVSQGFFFYWTARALNLSKTVSHCAAWLSWTVVSSIVFGHEFRTYISFGAYAQFIAIPSFLISLAWIAELTGWIHRGSKTSVLYVKTGMGLGLTFLLHHFFGCMLFVCLACMLLVSWAASFLSFRDGVTRLLVVMGVFFLIAGYQLLSIFQDAPLVLSTASFDPTRWSGYPLQKLLELFARGSLLDRPRLPLLTLFSFLGMVMCLRGKIKTFPERKILFLWLCLGFVFTSGGQTFKGIIRWIPVLKHMHLSRFLSLIHIVCIFLASLALGSTLERVVGLLQSRGQTITRLAASLLGGALLCAVAYLYLERTKELNIYRDHWKIQRQASTHWDEKLFSSMKKELKEGNFWAMTRDSPFLPTVGFVPVYMIAEMSGYSQFSAITSPILYPAHLPELFNPALFAHYRFFNIEAMVLPANTEVPTFVKKVYENKSQNLASFSTPAKSRWDVVRTSRIKFVQSPKDFQREVVDWFKSFSRNDQANYPALLPTDVGQRYPRAIPEVTPLGVTGEPGWVNHGSAFDGNHASATLYVQPDEKAYGLLRTAYHPRWLIKVNGKKVPPVWLGPGLLGFEVERGWNEVEIEFPSDPLRSTLFWLSLSSLLVASTLVCSSYALLMRLMR